MKRIHCNIIGTATDAPFIQADNGHVYVGYVENQRVTFPLQNYDTGGAYLRWLDQAARFIIPLDPGDYEGGSIGLPDLIYSTVPVLKPIHIDGTRFADSDGKTWIWKGCTDFLLYKYFLEGQDITHLLKERVALGANLVRVLGMAHYIDQFYPQRYHAYYDELAGFANLLALYGLSLEFVTFADQQVIQIPEQAHFIDCCTALRGIPNVVIELCNEYPKNGIDPRHFTKPQGLLASAGSALADQPPTVFWDFFGWHGRRDWPKVTSSAEDMWYVIRQQGIPGVHDEPARRDRPVEYNANLAAQLAASALVLGSGATFHSPDGIRSEPVSEQTRNDAHAFFNALNPQE